MLRLIPRAGVVSAALTLALLAVPAVAAPDAVQQDSYRASRAWSAGQALSILASFHATPRLRDEEVRAQTALDEVLRTVGVPPPAAPRLVGQASADLETRARFLVQGEGMRIIRAIRAAYGTRAGALAELATRIRLLGAAWPDDVARYGTDLLADVERLLPVARLPARLHSGLRGAITVRADARELATRVEEAMRMIDTYLVWWGNDPSEAEVRFVAWGFGIALDGLEAQALRKGITEEDQVLLLRFATRLGVHAPSLELGRVTGQAESREHIRTMRERYAPVMLSLLAMRNGGRAAALTALGWRLGTPSIYCLGVEQPFVCAAELQAQMTRQGLPPAIWQPAVEALRTGAPKEEVEKRLEAVMLGITAHLREAYEKRTPVPVAGPDVHPAYAKEASFEAAFLLARALLGAASQPDDPEAATALQLAVDAADDLGCIVPPPPEVGGTRASDLDAAVAYLRQGGGQLLATRIEQRAGSRARAFFDAGLWSEMLWTFYEPGAERTRRLAAALQEALTRTSFATEIWKESLEAVARGDPVETVTASLEAAQDDYGCEISELCSGRAFGER